jgi:hypothetical protein
MIGSVSNVRLSSVYSSKLGDSSPAALRRKVTRRLGGDLFLGAERDAMPQLMRDLLGDLVIGRYHTTVVNSSLGNARSFRFPYRCVDYRPEMDDPTQQEKPEHAGKHELDDGYEEPALNQLAESRDEKAAESRDHVTSGSLTSHRCLQGVAPKQISAP